AGLARFFRMELHAEDIPVFDCCSKGLNIVRSSDRRVRDRSTPGVREICELTRLNTGKQARSRTNVELIPADMRNLFCSVGKAVDNFRQIPQAGLVWSLGAASVQPLH